MPQLVTGKFRDLGDGFQVLRILPHIDARAIGPFVFMDHFGPAVIATGEELNVRPHPHIGLSTITYLYTGAVLHRDSLGSELVIRPGEANWMTAGSGVVHSEHSQKDEDTKVIEGIQTWVALPVSYEETAPAFDHYDAAAIPEIGGGNFTLRLIAGTLMGKTSPVKTHSALFYADLSMNAAAEIEIDFPAGQDAALYVSQGSFTVAILTAQVGSMIVLEPGSRVKIQSHSAARAVLLGGKKLPEPRHLWWNFVSSSKERIELAKNAWKANALGLVAGETDRIPLPE